MSPAHTDAPQAPVRPRIGGLGWTWILCFGSIALAFPAYSLAVFSFGLERRGVANVMSVHIAIAYWLGIFAAYLPFRALRRRSRFERLQLVVLPFVIASYVTHLTWELVWLLTHEAIAGAREKIWAYPWWAYMDGGDLRYLNPEPEFVMIEILSVTNALVGVTGLILLFRSRFTDIRGVLMVMATAVTHTVLTWQYYGSEIIAGFPAVNTDSFMDLGVRFIFLNGPWLVAPWFVLAWGYLLLARMDRRGVAEESS
ncbi:hypothetical protein [Nocardioides limicola]|uniref:hypothetical protein n=1 Tax=Nocardioides limicola TaxID=2803368 RepID=UPI00193C1F56|nr:hypothetical protein [Nocardioides sp. DJM-14]